MAGNANDERPVVRQDITAGRDAYAAARDVHVHEAPAAQPVPPSRLWGNVPARNALFTGRGEQLAGIREALLSGKHRVAVQALHGMGGIGKTQVAIEYAHRFAEDYEIVWWLDSENTLLLSQQYTDLAIALGCAKPGTPPGPARHAVRSELHDRPRWLLVFDNAGTPDSIRHWLPSGPGHVTRHGQMRGPNWPPWYQSTCSPAMSR
jgi:hypothetical protein